MVDLIGEPHRSPSGQPIRTLTESLPAEIAPRSVRGGVGPVVTLGHPMATIVYIDGFNLYYGALRGTPYKWLDLEALSQRLLPKDDVHLVRYFTARITARPDDPQQHT